MVEFKIPFPGFYESWLSCEVDREIEQFAENRCEDDDLNYPRELQIPVSDYHEATFMPMDFGTAYDSVARTYLQEFDAWAAESLGIGESCGFEWSLMTSPREYNFETDRLFATAPRGFVARLFRMSRADGHETLRRVIEDRFTSRSGFISHYSPDLDAWDMPSQWDHNQLETLLIACLEISGADDESFMLHMLDSGGTFYSAFDSAFDFDRFDAEIAEKRAELLQAWLVDDSQSAANWREGNRDKFAAIVAADPSLFEEIDLPECDVIGAWYRCDRTGDMFA